MSMLSRVLFVAFSLMFDRTTTGDPTPWVLLGMLTCVTAAVLCLVVVTKPYVGGGSDADSGGMSEGDRQMVLAQSLQLVCYAVGGLCVWSDTQHEAGQTGPSGGVETFSALVGLVVVLVQATPVVLAFFGRGGRAAATSVSTTSFSNPMADDAKDLSTE